MVLANCFGIANDQIISNSARRLIDRHLGLSMDVPLHIGNVDLQGRVVQRTRPTGRTTALGDMPSGVYLFRMWTEGGVVVRRMVVE